jgi:hypothetical protein
MSSYRNHPKHKVRKKTRGKLRDRRLKSVEFKDLLPLSPKLEQLLLDSWRDNEELYRSLK